MSQSSMQTVWYVCMQGRYLNIIYITPFHIYPELGTLEWDTFNPDCLIRISNVDTFYFLLNPFLFGYSTEKSKTGFWKLRESLPFLYINLEWRAKCQISRLLIRDTDWLNFIHFSGYKYKIRLVSLLRKREDQALITISTILKFSALEINNMMRTGNI